MLRKNIVQVTIIKGLSYFCVLYICKHKFKSQAVICAILIWSYDVLF